MSSQTAIRCCDRFPVDHFDCKRCAAAELMPRKNGESLLWGLVEPLVGTIRGWDADFLVLGTTKGEVDLLERECRGNSSVLDYSLDSLLRKMFARLCIKHGCVVSSACASSSLALARAAETTAAGKYKRIAVMGVDIVSEFVFSGFSALQALSSDNSSPTPVKPFDSRRDGLAIGEACAAVLLEGTEYSKGDIGGLVGWGAASDANHVTGPSREGDGLVAAINAALALARLSPEDIAAVCAHGTGTSYNDSMEMAAYKKVFKKEIPVFSVKGSIGHTMGAAGLLESIVSLKALERRTVPPTVGFKTPDSLSDGWVSDMPQKIQGDYILKTNSGFGGINTALVFRSRG